jgi:hypothetical protein
MLFWSVVRRGIEPLDAGENDDPQERLCDAPRPSFSILRHRGKPSLVYH